MLFCLIVVQVMNLKLTEEVEKLETMLKLQSSINKDLHQVLCIKLYCIECCVVQCCVVSCCIVFYSVVFDCIRLYCTSSTVLNLFNFDVLNATYSALKYVQGRTLHHIKYSDYFCSDILRVKLFNLFNSITKTMLVKALRKILL